jgi:hypothetical protein
MKKEFIEVKKEKTLKVTVIGNPEGKEQLYSALFYTLGITAPKEQKVARYLVKNAEKADKSKGDFYRFFGTLKDIAKVGGFSTKPVQDALKSLEELELIERDSKFIKIKPILVKSVTEISKNGKLRMVIELESEPDQLDIFSEEEPEQKLNNEEKHKEEESEKKLNNRPKTDNKETKKK